MVLPNLLVKHWVERRPLGSLIRNQSAKMALATLLYCPKYLASCHRFWHGATFWRLARQLPSTGNLRGNPRQNVSEELGPLLDLFLR